MAVVLLAEVYSKRKENATAQIPRFGHHKATGGPGQTVVDRMATTRRTVYNSLVPRRPGMHRPTPSAPRLPGGPAVPYIAEISRTNPTRLLFLIMGLAQGAERGPDGQRREPPADPGLRK
jgi:hypothetical protein